MSDWNPGADPYSGSLQSASEDFISAGADPYIIHLLTSAAEKYESGHPTPICNQSTIKPNEYFYLMESGHGLMSNVTAPAVGYWPENLSQQKIECQINGHSLAKPHACGNWTYTPPIHSFPPTSTWVNLPNVPEWLFGPGGFGPFGEGEFGFGGFGGGGLSGGFIASGQPLPSSAASVAGSLGALSPQSPQGPLNGSPTSPTPSPGIENMPNSPVQVPEPATFALLTICIVCVALVTLFRRWL